MDDWEKDDFEIDTPKFSDEEDEALPPPGRVTGRMASKGEADESSAAATEVTAAAAADSSSAKASAPSAASTAAPAPSGASTAAPAPSGARPLHYGAMKQRLDNSGPQRLQFGSWFGKMSKELLAYLQAEPPYSMSRENVSKLTKFGFKECDDGHKLGGHRYYEGYWHASLDPSNKATWHESKPGMNPRYGVPMLKRAAPPRMFAFVQAFRSKNRKFFAGIYERMVAELKSSGGDLPAHLAEMRRASADAVRDCFGDASGSVGALADVSVQIHFGKSAPPVWHIDAANSLIHFSITLGGERELHWREAEAEDSADDSVHKRTLLPGDLYLSSPVAFMHGVHYSRDCDWGRDMVLALQVRLSFTLEQRSHLADRHWLCQVMAEHIRSFSFECPSLAEVESSERDLAASAPQKESGGCKIS